VAWLLNDGHRFMADRLISTPVPQYDHHWHITADAPLCRYVFTIHRDSLFTDLFTKLAK
jgi:hypothetical protein